MNLNSGVTFSFPGRQTDADTICLDAADVKKHNNATIFPEAIGQRIITSAGEFHG
jgi:hypothetical protein